MAQRHERLATFAIHSNPKDICLPTNDEIKASVVAPSSPLISPQMFESDTIGTALHVIETEQNALANLSHVYRTDAFARRSMAEAVNTISKVPRRGGRLIVIGVGKSGKIAEKCVATMNSLGIRSAFLHPTEALHGDMGMIGPADAILMITFSGKTPELLSLLPHISTHLPHIIVSAHMDPASCLLISKHKSRVWTLLPAPIPVSEVQSFGVAAPTSSTTVALALTDALALATARTLHTDPDAVFRRNHPGGAIGGSI